MSFDGIRGYVQFATGIGDATRARAGDVSAGCDSVERESADAAIEVEDRSRLGGVDPGLGLAIETRGHGRVGLEEASWAEVQDDVGDRHTKLGLFGEWDRR